MGVMNRLASPDALARVPIVPAYHEMPAFEVNVAENCPATALPLLDSILQLPQVRVRNPALVAQKLAQMVLDGQQKFLVISDFDYTLSRFHGSDGGQCWTTHGVFDNCANLVDSTLGEKLKTLKAKYHPIEFCPQLTMEEKIPHMETWWSESHKCIVESGFTKDVVREFVKKSNIVLRDQATHLFRGLESLKVPLIIFSAGIGNIIEFFLEDKFEKIPSNIHVISNSMIFNSEGRVNSFTEPLIHTFCKNSSVIRKESDFFHEVSGRTNVLLLGDSMGDIHMDVGVEKDGPTLKIGFLNANVEGLLDHYMKEYDIVLLQDSSMCVPNLIMDAVLGRSSG